MSTKSSQPASSTAEPNVRASDNETAYHIAFDDKCDHSFQSPKILGVIVLALTTIALVSWSQLAPLSSAVIAPGTLQFKGHRHLIQHPVSAVTDRVHVNDGDYVNAGELLITLNTDDLKTSALSLRVELLQIKLEKTRQHALLTQRPQLVIADELQQLATAMGQPQRLALEHTAWKQHHQKLARDLEILDQKEARLNVQLEKEVKLLDHWQKQIGLLSHDQKAMNLLNEQSMVPRSQKMKIDHAMIELQKNYDSTHHAIALQQLELSTLPSQRLAITETASRMARQRYQELDRQEPQLSRQLDLILRKIEQAKIISPINGRVNRLNVGAAGGVISANTPLMEVVPSSGQLLVEAKLSTEDIDALNGAEKASVRLTALNSRHHPTIQAQVQSISADVIENPQGKPFYRMLLTLDNPTDDSIYPGMRAQVFIPTGSFSVYDFLIGRLIQSSERGLRETL